MAVPYPFPHFACLCGTSLKFYIDSDRGTDLRVFVPFYFLSLNQHHWRLGNRRCLRKTFYRSLGCLDPWGVFLRLERLAVDVIARGCDDAVLHAGVYRRLCLLCSNWHLRVPKAKNLNNNVNQKGFKKLMDGFVDARGYWCNRQIFRGGGLRYANTGQSLGIDHRWNISLLWPCCLPKSGSRCKLMD